jgi:predicted nucleic acid-binding Zn ribbon protein
MKPPFRFMPPLGARKSTAKEHVLALWRGVDLTSEETARAATSKKAADLLPGVLKTLRLDRRQSETEVVKVWNTVLNPNITKHAQPTGLNKGTLFVTVDSNVWLSEIMRYHKREIMERLRHSFGPDLVTKISFRVG